MMIERNRVIAWVIGASAVVLLTACVEGSPRQQSTAADCGSTNWYDVGFEDGSRGFPQEKVDEYRSCPVFARPEPFDAYRAGWDAGIEGHCSEENGFLIGANGAPISNTCPRSLTKSFKKGHKLGNKVYKTDQKRTERVATLQLLDSNIQSGRYTPDQLEVLLKDRRKELNRLSKEEKTLAKLFKRVRKRGYPTQSSAR